MRISTERIINLANLKNIKFYKSYFAWEFYYNDDKYEFIGSNKNLKAYNFLSNLPQKEAILKEVC